MATVEPETLRPLAKYSIELLSRPTAGAEMAASARQCQEKMLRTTFPMYDNLLTISPRRAYSANSLSIRSSCRIQPGSIAS